jgi:SCY1-like protein 1
VLTIITKLSDRTINGELLKYLARTANDEQPGIRTNTTICLGKIAKHLGTSSRSKVLVAAFTRSLRDPFLHARNAALMALGATSEFFSEEDCATKLLPVMCPLLIDKERLIRDQAGKTMELYLQKVRKAAAGMPDSVLPPPASSDSSAAPRMSTPQASEAASWTGWAISSFTNKLSAASGEMQTPGTGSGSSTPWPAAPSPSLEPKKSATSSASALHRQAVKSPPPSMSRQASANASAAAAAFFPDDGDEGDAWGDMGDDDDAFFDKPKETTSTLTTTKKTAAASAAPFDDGSEPDFAGWLAAQSQKKPGSGKPLPKGLAKSTTTTINTKKTTTTKPAAKPVAAKKIDMKPKETDDDDGWGDGW